MEGVSVSEFIKKVVSSIDDNYLYPYIVFLYSAWVTSSKPREFVLAYSSKVFAQESQETLVMLSGYFNINLTLLEIQIPSEIQGYSHIPSTSYARLILADKMVEPFLWLDADILCLQGWDRLFDNFDSHDRCIGAVSEDSIIFDTLNMARVRKGASYFNAGVLQVNPSVWEKHGHTAEWIDAYRNRSVLGFEWGDQCILNYVVENQYSKLEEVFNYRWGNHYFGTPSIVHFTGDSKPWHFNSTTEILLSADYAKYTYAVLYKKYENELLKRIKSDEKLHKYILGLQKASLRKPRRRARFTESVISTLRLLELRK
jgi:lipopolysaccharide biosynthesis glycosyltransferase